MSFPPYAEYKDSGSPWIGAVPSHWNLLPVKRGFVRRKVLNTGMACENRFALTMRGVVPRDLDDLDGLQASEFETYQVFQANDLAFKLIDLQNIKTSRVGLVPDEGIMSPAYIRLEPNKAKVLPRFAYWFFTDLYNRQVFNQLGGGVRQTLGPEELLTLPFPFAPSSEQFDVCIFLDQETTKIDALIAEQAQLIALLREKRQAVISHAVTQGLAPDAPMNDSGVKWLGLVPAHWRITPVKYFAHVGNGSTPNRDRTEYWENGSYPWLSSTVVNQDFVIEAEEFVTPLALAECHLPTVTPPAVLIGITGQGKTRGMATTLMFEATVNQHIAFVKVGSADVDIAYLRRYFEMAYSQMRYESDGGGSTKGAITCEQIQNMRMPLPPLDEQRAITAFVDVEIAKLDELTSAAQSATTLLQEHRSALIYAAVTGKIDVRKAA